MDEARAGELQQRAGRLNRTYYGKTEMFVIS
jgi:hypothetical protein